MARKKKTTETTTETTTEMPAETTAETLDMKLVLAATIVMREMHEGIPREVYRAFQSWEAYGSLSDITIGQVRKQLERNKDGVNFEKRLMVAKSFIDYVFNSTS